MLVDDPVKRVDNMTMAWGWRRGCRSSTTIRRTRGALPGRPQARRRRQGCLKEARGLLPAEIIDRKKGYFPVPGIRHLSAGPGAGAGRTDQRHRAQSGQYRPERRGVVGAPNDTRTALGQHARGSSPFSRCGCRAWKVDRSRTGRLLRSRSSNPTTARGGCTFLAGEVDAGKQKSRDCGLVSTAVQAAPTLVYRQLMARSAFLPSVARANILPQRATIATCIRHATTSLSVRITLRFGE